MHVVGQDAPVSDVIELTMRTGHSRFPVTGEDLDDVVGLVHVKHAVAVDEPQREQVLVREVMVRAELVPASLHLDPLLESMRAGGLQLAVVVDEFGGTDGLVTAEDLIEELVGDVTDEHDRQSTPIRRQPDGTWLLSGQLRPDEIADVTDVWLPEDRSYETVAGLIAKELGRIPAVDDVVELPNARLTVRRTVGRRVDRVQLERSARPSADRTGMNESAALLLGALLLVTNAFFVGAEFALISARRSQIAPLAASGSRAARTTLYAMMHVSVMLAGAQLGITVCSLGLGAVAEPALAHLIESPLQAVGISDQWTHPIAFVLALLLVVALHVVLGEMVPKNIALAGPERAALLLAPPLALMVRLLGPIVHGFNAIANLTLRMLRVQPRGEVASAFTRDEVAGLIEESHRHGLLDDEEHDRLAGALSIETRDVMSVVMPLADLVTVSTTTTPRQVEQIAGRTGFSRFPVRDEQGEISKYLHLKDILSHNPATRDAPIQAKRLRPLVAVERRETLRSALGRMKSNGAHLARVVDEAGVTLGVIALDDVLEELVGEIRAT